MNRLLGMVSDVDGYWSRHELGMLFNECQMTLGEHERSAFGLILRGLHRLYPFDYERDHPKNIRPRHAI